MVGDMPLTSEARLSQGPMLQFRHQTKQLCVIDEAHSIHLNLGSSNNPIEVTPANPPKLSLQRSKLDLPSWTSLPARGRYAVWYATLMIFCDCDCVDDAI